MKYIFSHINEICKILDKKSPFLMLDYDGTLTPIVRNPSQARFGSSTRKLLESLRNKYKIAIISGRRLEEIKNLIKIKDLYYVGNHGLEISGPKFNFVHKIAKDSRYRIQSIYKKLVERLKNIKGVMIENKAFSLSIHYRLVSYKNISSIRNSVYKIAKPYALKIRGGKKVIEIRPDTDWNKGAASQLLLKIAGDKSRTMGYSLVRDKSTPLYIGDDQTDEDAFKMFRNCGITVKVGKSKSAAQFFVDTSFEVIKLLKILNSRD